MRLWPKAVMAVSGLHPASRESAILWSVGCERALSSAIRRGKTGSLQYGGHCYSTDIEHQSWSPRTRTLFYVAAVRVHINDLTPDVAKVYGTEFSNPFETSGVTFGPCRGRWLHVCSKSLEPGSSVEGYVPEENSPQYQGDPARASVYIDPVWIGLFIL